MEIGTLIGIIGLVLGIIFGVFSLEKNEKERIRTVAAVLSITGSIICFMAFTNANNKNFLLKAKIETQKFQIESLQKDLKHYEDIHP